METLQNPGIIPLIFAQLSSVVLLITSRNHQDISVKSAAEDYRWAACQPVCLSGVILSEVLRPGLVVLIKNCNPRFLPEGGSAFIMKSLAVPCLVIREINFHIIFSGNEIWRFKGEIQRLSTRG